MSSQDNTPSPAEAAKNAGNALLAARNFEGAIARYTEAIALDSSEAKFYSNRALALSKLGRYPEVIRDADTAAAKDPAFLKPQYFKADALVKLRKFDAARAVASAALGKEPPAALKANLEKLVVTASASQETQSNAGIVGKIKRAVPAQRLVAVVLGLVYFIPVPLGFTVSCYRFSLLSIFSLLAFEVYAVHGKPWGMAFMQRVLDPNRRYLDYTLHRAIMAAFLVVCNPYALGLMSLMLFEVCQLVVVDLPRMNILGTGARISELVHQKLLPGLLASNTRNQTIAAKWIQLRQQIMNWTAHLEVFLGIFLLVELLTPWRSIMLTVLLWQFLRTIAMFCQETRDAFWNIDQQLKKVLAYIPPVASLYTRFSAYLATWGDLPAQPAQAPAGAEAGGGFMQRAAAAASSCNIM
eukprot:INCI1537.3.p1 GENE.INCI1537.3~~INCI1537.3.p1  ORF type:complete len:411 (+),score=72.35 INCI1537.3:35-1267(+)